jgi:hypothetical protein
MDETFTVPLKAGDEVTHGRGDRKAAVTSELGGYSSFSTPTPDWITATPGTPQSASQHSGMESGISDSPDTVMGKSTTTLTKEKGLTSRDAPHSGRDRKTATASGREGCHTSFVPIPDCEKTAPSTSEGGPTPSQNSFQIYVRGSRGTERFEIESQEDLSQQIKRRWDLNRDQYRVSPELAIRQEGAAYELVKIVRGGIPDSIAEWRARFGRWLQDTRGQRSCRFWFEGELCDAYLQEWTADE